MDFSLVTVTSPLGDWVTSLVSVLEPFSPLVVLVSVETVRSQAVKASGAVMVSARTNASVFMIESPGKEV